MLAFSIPSCRNFCTRAVKGLGGLAHVAFAETKEDVILAQ